MREREREREIITMLCVQWILFSWLSQPFSIFSSPLRGPKNYRSLFPDPYSDLCHLETTIVHQRTVARLLPDLDPCKSWEQGQEADPERGGAREHPVDLQAAGVRADVPGERVGHEFCGEGTSWLGQHHHPQSRKT